MLKSTQLTEKIVSGLVALTVALIVGCSSDSNPAGGGGGGGGTNPIASQLATATATIPGPLEAAANANPSSGAGQGVGYFNRYNSINSTSGWFTGSPPNVRTRQQSLPADTTTYMYGA